MKIFIDAGHNFSGADGGSIGNNIREQDVTFIIANKLKKLFLKSGYDVKLSREKLTDNVGDTLNESLATRVSMSNYFNADLFISIHCNAFDGKVSGTETLVYTLTGKAADFAKKVQSAIVNNLGTVNRGVKSRPDLMVLRGTNCPAILVETAFIDNISDSWLLINRTDDFASAIYEGVTGIKLIDSSTELITVNDIVYELKIRNIISDTSLWLKKLEEDKNAYFLAKKAVNYIRQTNS